jgi:hypothetical protein
MKICLDYNKLSNIENHYNCNFTFSIYRLRENNRPEINFMQKNSPVFLLFQKGIDAKMKELTQAGIGKFSIRIIY